jgi:hypothetical protein
LNRERLAAIAYDIEPVDLEGEFGCFARGFSVSQAPQ